MSWNSESGPLMIVKTDSSEYRLDSLSMNGIDPEWIQSISVFKDGNAIDIYGCKGKHGVIIIRLKDDHIVHFIEGRKPETPLQLKKVPNKLD